MRSLSRLNRVIDELVAESRATAKTFRELIRRNAELEYELEFLFRLLRLERPALPPPSSGSGSLRALHDEQNKPPRGRCRKLRTELAHLHQIVMEMWVSFQDIPGVCSAHHYERIPTHVKRSANLRVSPDTPRLKRLRNRVRLRKILAARKPGRLRRISTKWSSIVDAVDDREVNNDWFR